MLGVYSGAMVPQSPKQPKSNESKKDSWQRGHFVEPPGLFGDLMSLSLFPQKWKPKYSKRCWLQHRHLLAELKDNQGVTYYQEQLHPESPEGLCQTAIVSAADFAVSSRLQDFRSQPHLYFLLSRGVGICQKKHILNHECFLVVPV